MKTSLSVFQWLPRILCILTIIFISLFAADSFNSSLSFWQQLKAFLIHLIPSFILLAILVIAWKREFLGGILFILVGCVCSPLLFRFNFNMNNSVVKSLGIMFALAVPFILVGILFLISHHRKKKNPV